MDESSKIFRLPGTIEEEEEEEQQKGTEGHKAKELIDNTAESLLLGQKCGSTLSTLPRNITLIRVNTQSSSIAGGIGRQDSTRSRYRAGPTRKLRRRAVLKNGDCNVLQSRISRRSLRFLQDIFTTLVDTQWRWTLMCFMLSFLLSWLGFAVIWWLIAFTHGDFEEHHLPPYQIESNWTPCVYNIFSFTSCFLFSIETQHTIGYGSRSTTEECPEAIFIMCLQSIAGVMIQAFMVGIVFAKMTRPKQRSQTLLFSRNAVICQRDGELCLMFRVGDMRKSHIIGASVRAQMIRNKTTKEGEVLSQHQHELVVGTDGENGDLFFIWPATIIHRINESSPFYNMSAEDMLIERFEVVLILEGTIESTGQTTQARSSYLPQEILWGHRFDPMVSYSKERQGYEVDYSLFNSTTQVDTPLCSGRELAEFYKAQEELRQGTDVLIDEDRLMRQQCGCNCHPTNHQCLQLSLPLDCARSHNSMDNEYYWQNICKCSNCILYEPQIASINQSKVFDFDAIQVMENEELQQLPEAINREIVKNSEEIFFEEKEEISERNVSKLNEGKSYNREILLKKREKDVWMQKAREKDMINNNQEIKYEDTKDSFLKSHIIWLNEKDADLKNYQEPIFKQEEGILERKLVKSDERIDDTMKNRHIYKKEQLAFIKAKENPKDIRHLIRHTLYKPNEEYKMTSNGFTRKDHEEYLEKRQKLNNKKYQLIMSVNQDKKSTENNIFVGKERNFQRRFDRSLSDDFLTVSDKRAFKEPMRNRNNKLILSLNQDKNSKRDLFPFGERISSKKYHRSCNMKNVRILEKGQKFSQQIPKYPASCMASLEHLNRASKSIFNQQSNYEYLRWQNDDLHCQMKQHDNIKIENEKILKKSLSHRPKITIQDKFYSNDICSLDSLAYDLSPESGFCERNSYCRELFTRNMKNVENTNSLESNLSLENTISDIGNPKQCIKSHSVEAITSINNSIKGDEIIASPYFNSSFKNSIDDRNNLEKYADASIIKKQFVCMENEEQNTHEASSCPNTLSRKLVSNFNKLEKSLSDEELMTRKSDFLNIDTSCKHIVSEVERIEWFDDTITAQKQIDHSIIRNNEEKSKDFSNIYRNTSCENVVNDIIAPDYLKECNNSILTEGQVCSNNMVKDRQQIYNFSNNTASKNLVIDIVNLDSTQYDNDYLSEHQVVYKNKTNDNDITNANDIKDCFV